MNIISDSVVFVVNFAVNLFLLGSLIAVTLVILLRLLRNVSPRLRYIILVIAFLAAVLMPFVITIGGSFGQVSSLETITGTVLMRGIEKNFGRNEVITEETCSLNLAQTPEFTAAGSLNSFTLFVTDSAIGSIFPIVWILGAVYFLVRDGAAYRQLRKTRKRWKPATDSDRKELLCPENTRLYFDEYESPGTIGLFRPVIVLPKRFPDDFSLESRRYIVQHELAHVRWRDPLVNSLLRLICSVFWVSPALWLIKGFISAEREAAADYSVILKFSTNESELETTVLNFAETLVSVAKQFNAFKQQNRFNHHVMGIGADSGLENRVRRLLVYSSRTSVVSITLAAITFVISLTAFTAIPFASVPIKPNIPDSAPEGEIISSSKEKITSSIPDEIASGNTRALRQVRQEVPSVFTRNSERKNKSSSLRSGEIKSKTIPSVSEEELPDPESIVPKEASTSAESEPSPISPRIPISKKAGVSPKSSLTYD